MQSYSWGPPASWASALQCSTVESFWPWPWPAWMTWSSPHIHVLHLSHGFTYVPILRDAFPAPIWPALAHPPGHTLRVNSSVEPPSTPDRFPLAPLAHWTCFHPSTFCVVLLFILISFFWVVVESKTYVHLSVPTLPVVHGILGWCECLIRSGWVIEWQQWCFLSW